MFRSISKSPINPPPVRIPLPTKDTGTKITYDSTGKVLSSTELLASDIPDLNIDQITDLQDTLDDLAALAIGGTVTAFSSGDLSPLFTTSVADPTTTPALSFTLTGAGTNQLLGLDSAGTSLEYKTVSGTTNQVTVTHGVNSIGLSLPQNIHTNAEPTFDRLTLAEPSVGFGNHLTISGTAASRIGMSNTSNNANIIINNSNSGTNINLNSGVAPGSTIQSQPRLTMNSGYGTAHSAGDILGSLQFGGIYTTATPGAPVAAQLVGYADRNWLSTDYGANLAVMMTSTDLGTQIETFRCVATGETELRGGYGLRFYDSDNTNYIGFIPPVTGDLTSDYTYTLPEDYGTNTHVLTTDGAGVLTWEAPSELNTPPTIRPSQLTADEDNYSPTSYSTTVAQYIDISGDSSFRFITGLEATADGVTKTFTNIGDNCVGFAKYHPDSDAANQFSFEEILLPGMSLTMRYDLTNTIWRLVSTTKDQVHFVNQHDWDAKRIGVVYANDFFNAAANSGTMARTSSSSTYPVGYSTASTSTSASAFPAFQGYTGTIFLLVNKSYLRITARVSLSTLSTGSETYTARIGYTVSTVESDQEGFYFSYTDSENSGGWTIRTNDGTNPTTSTPAGSPISATTNYDLELIYYPWGEVVGFVDGVRYSTTTTLPTNIRQIPFIMLDKSAGTTATILSLTHASIREAWVSE